MPPADRGGKRPPRRRRDPIRDAASEAGAASGGAAGNGNGNGNGDDDWVDYDTPAGSWDPWDEGDGDHDARGLNRTLGEWLEAVVPVEAQVHFYNAGREFALGLQTTFEYHLRRGQEEDGAQGPQHIEIE